MAENVKKAPASIRGAVAAVPFGVFTAFLVRGAEGVHAPLLAAAVSGILIGFIDPRKGWIAALVQSVVLAAAAWGMRGDTPAPEVETYSLFGAVGLTFIGSFIGAFIKRALDS